MTPQFSVNSSHGESTAMSEVNTSSVIPVPEGCVVSQSFQFVSWREEDSLVPKEVDNIIKLLFTGVFLPILFVVSFSTNIINMVVFYKHGLKERINACLFTLSAVDLLSISIAYGFCSDVLYMFVIGKGGELGPITQFFVRYYVVGFYGFVTASQMVYCVIALERCLCITRPLLVKSFMSTRTTVIVLWTMVVVITGVCVLVGGVRYGVLCVFNPADNSISYVNYPKDFYFRHKVVMDFMYSIVYGMFFPGVCFISVTICTVVTAMELKKLSRWRENASSASGSVTSRDMAITRTIVATSVLFMICIVPAIVMRSTFLIVPEMRVGGRYDNLAWVARRFFQLTSAINNTINFFIYYFYGSKFRETTNQLFCGNRNIQKSHDVTGKLEKTDGL
ncbi:uncharacterized protein LOC143300686 [Babylonia areolata]|uniref:uncharacterized protein LOC143300686 n=1 Tax=Babylonia areolata TaxID=304850 RepID=UPI003FCF5CA3